MKFSHPLARSGSVWAATTLDDKAHDNTKREILPWGTCEVYFRMEHVSFLI
jgi:hypothetical protein